MKRRLLFLFIALGLIGCTTSVSYVTYTQMKFPPKSKYYFVTLYPETQKLPATQPYYVIGRVDLSGMASDGVSPDTLADKAKAIARKKGADAIINARTTVAEVGGVYAISEYSRYHRYASTEYIPYTDQRLAFRGELIVFKPAVINETP